MVDNSDSANQPQTPVNSTGLWPRRRWLIILPSLGLVLALIVIAVLATKLSAAGDDGRTISVTGEATLQETPDQYVFYPSYTFKNADKTAALAELTAKSEAVVAGLKQVGVSDNDIKTNSNGYDNPVYYDTPDSMSRPADPPEAVSSSYNLQLTITVKDKALAQKVQDYLLTTSPSGTVSPQASFSDAKRKSLESKARDLATKDARSKADQSAKNLGFKISDVKSVDDGSGFGVMPYEGRSELSFAMDADKPSQSQMTVQPGQNDFSYSVTVVYKIR